jgi:predicted MFS family arabinose efflux permease
MTVQRPSGEVGTGGLLLVTAAITGWATAIAMIGPLLVDLSREFAVPLGQLGLLGAVMSLPWALGAPLTGLLSDRLGRRPLMVLALLGVGVSSIGAAFATDFTTLLVVRFVGGIFGAFGPASTMAAVAGVPAIGVVAGLFGWRWAFGACGLALFALGALIHFGFPSPPPSGGGASLRVTYGAVLGVPRLGNVLGANLFERSIFNAAVLYLPSFLMLSYGLGPAEVAPALAVVAVGSIGGNTVGGWLGDRLPRAAVFVGAQTVAAVIALMLFGLTPGLVLSVLAAGAFGLANAASRPAFLALGSELSPRYRGALLGLLSLTNQGGVVLGSSLGGLALGLGSYGALAVLTLLGGATAAVLALPLARDSAAVSR